MPSHEHRVLEHARRACASCLCAQLRANYIEDASYWLYIALGPLPVLQHAPLSVARCVPPYIIAQPVVAIARKQLYNITA